MVYEACFSQPCRSPSALVSMAAHAGVGNQLRGVRIEFGVCGNDYGYYGHD